MRHLTIILLFACLSLNAQNWKKGLAVAGYHLGTVALGAIGDGLYDSGSKEWSHALHAAEVGALISGPFVFNLGHGIVPSTPPENVARLAAIIRGEA